MTRFPHDQFAKDFLESLLSPLGEVQTSLKVSGEVREMDVYLLSTALKTGIIVIHQLPQTPASLWFRLLGKGKVQSQAIDEVAALPPDNPYRQNALDLLGNLKVILEARAIIEPEEQNLIMQLSPLYLEKIHAAEQVGRQDGKQALILRLLAKRVGIVSSEVEARVKALSLAMLEELFDAALDFTQMNDLMTWLDGHQ